jgi:hypothetical protein
MSWSQLPGTDWAPRIAGIATVPTDSMPLQRLLAAVSVLAVAAVAVGALWALFTGTLVSGRQVPAIIALVFSLGVFAAVVGYSVTSTE